MNSTAELEADSNSSPGNFPSRQEIVKHRFAEWSVWIGVACLTAYGALSPNGVLTSFAIITLPVVIKLLWVRGEPPVLAFACAMQWLQASAAIFYTDHNHVSLEQTFGNHQLETASWLSLIAVLVLAAGMRLALVRRAANRHHLIAYAASKVNLGKAFFAYLIASAVGTQLGNYAWSTSGLTQILVAMGGQARRRAIGRFNRGRFIREFAEVLDKN